MQPQTLLWIILAALLAAGLALFQYVWKKRKHNWVLLSVLRFVSWFCLFLLLLNPKFTQKTQHLEKPTLVVAVDNSASIANFGEGERVENFLSKLSENEGLIDNFNIETYLFGEKVQPKDYSAVSFSEKRTEIGGALRQIREIHKGKTAPVVLVTDGNQTFGENYVYTAQQLGQPVYPVVVGDTTKYMDLRIGQLNTNKYVFLNNKFPVEVFVDYNGMGPVSQEFRLESGNSVVYRKTLEFSEENSTEKVSFSLPANSVGVKTYSAVIEAVSDEKNTVNNTRDFAIEVIDEKTNVLILYSVMHPDLGAIKKAIESNQQRAADIKKIGGKLDLGKYQLVILYQPTQVFKPVYDKINKLKINTFTIAGTETDYNFLNSVQQVFSKQSTSQSEDYLPVFNSNYTVFQLENIDFDDFPPLKDQFGKFAVKEVVHPILHKSVNGIETGEPLWMTAETADGQRKAWLFGEGIWKWRAKSYVDQRSFSKFDEFFGKSIQYLASTKRRSRLEVDYESFYRKGEPLVIEARYFDKNYVFDPRAKLHIALKNKVSKERTERPFLLKNRGYEVNLSDLPPGEYQFTVSVENQSLMESGEFTLIAFDVEKQFMNANLGKLRQVAINPNKKVYFLNKPEALATDLLTNNAFKPVQKTRKTNMPLIEWYYLLGIIVLALAVEWFIRKYRGLV